MLVRQPIRYREKIMPIDMPSYLENRRKFLANRQKFSLDELAKHLGCWIAWSPDGTRILASAANPEDLEECVRAAGEDFNQCVLEGIPDNDSLIGGGLNGESA